MRAYMKNTKSIKGWWGDGSNGSAFAKQARGPEFKP
jgi:hypothetical protein